MSDHPSKELQAQRGQNWHEPRELTDEERQSVIDYITDNPHCSLREAAVNTGVHRSDIKLALKNDGDWLNDYREARGYAPEQIFKQMVRLGIEGVDEPLVSAGKIVGTKRVYNDRVLTRLYDTITPEGKAALANKLGIEIDVNHSGSVELQKGIGWDAVVETLRAAGKEVPALEAPEGTAEIISVEDE